MERENLIKYLENLKCKGDFTSFAGFIKVLWENIDDYLEDAEVLSLFRANVKSIGANLNYSDRLKEAFPMYEAMQSSVLCLWKQGKIDYTEKNSYDVMYIKCLVSMNKKEKAINEASQIFMEFMRNRNRILKDVRNPKARNIVFLLTSIKAICRYAKSLCRQLGNDQKASDFYQQERTVQRFIRCHGGIEDITDYELCNEHRPLAPSINIYIGTHLSEIKGRFKRLKFCLKILLDLTHNWLSYLFWGYGERPWNTVIAMVGFVLIFAGIYLHYNVFATVGDVNFGNCLYYSFITFVTLGFGNIYPIDATYARVLVGMQAFIGTILIALFIFTLGRRATR